MKKRIVTKHYIQFETATGDMRVRITQKEYNKQLIFLRGQIGQTFDDLVFSEGTETYDFDNYTKTIHIFGMTGSFGPEGTQTILYVLKCKDGKTFLDND